MSLSFVLLALVSKLKRLTLGFLMYKILTELICVSALLRQKQKRHGLDCLFANDMSSSVGKKHQMHMLTRLQTRVSLGDLLALPGGILNY